MQRGPLKTTTVSVVTSVYGNVQQFECFMGCGAILTIDTPQILHRGHVIAHVNGGVDSVANLKPVCRTCNLFQGTEHMYAFMKMHGRRPPIQCPEFEQYPQAPLPLKIFEPREIRNECIKNAREYLQKYGNLHGVISSPTGSGKTVMALELANELLCAGGIILWITERVDILSTQFTPANIYHWKAAGLIPADCAVLYRDHLKYCEIFPQKCIIASTIDTAMGEGRYNKLPRDRFLGVIVDETHMAEGDRTADMLLTLKPFSKIMLGLSATHKFDDRMHKLYGREIDGGVRITTNNVFLEYNYMEALRDGIIRGVDFKISRAEKITGADSTACLFDKITPEGREKIFAGIMSLSAAAPAHKGIIWCGGIRSAEKWYEFMKEKGAPVLLDHSRLSAAITSTGFLRFCHENNLIMIAARKHAQGVDIPGLDFAASIDETAVRDPRVFLQMVGRLTRKGGSPRATFCEFVVCESEEIYTQEIKSMIEEYYFGISEKIHRVGEPAPGEFNVTRAGNGAGRLAINVGEIAIAFEILDGIHDVEIFARDEKFVANLLCRTGRTGMDYLKLKEFLAAVGIRRPAVAEMFFRSLYDSGAGDVKFTAEGVEYSIYVPADRARDICAWWGVVRYMGVNYNHLLDIDTDQYYVTLGEARAAIHMLVHEIPGAAAMDVMKLYRRCCEIDKKLPADPLSTYKCRSITMIIDICDGF